MRVVHIYVHLPHPLEGTVLLECPFGLKSASEVFQKRAFEGIEGIHIIADDIIIPSSNVEKHDKIFTEVLQRATVRNV